MIPRLSESPSPAFLGQTGLMFGDVCCSFLKCFKRIFQPSALSALISFVNKMEGDVLNEEDIVNQVGGRPAQYQWMQRD